MKPAAWLALLLLVPVMGATDFSGRYGNGGATGAIDVSGPEWLDKSFSVQFLGDSSSAHPPAVVIVDDVAYFVSEFDDDAGPGSLQGRLHYLDLATGDHGVAVAFPGDSHAGLSHADGVIVGVVADTVFAWEPSKQGTRWETGIPGSATAQWCRSSAAAANLVVIGCGQAETYVFHGLALDSGQLLWSLTREDILLDFVDPVELFSGHVGAEVTNFEVDLAMDGEHVVLVATGNPSSNAVMMAVVGHDGRLLRVQNVFQGPGSDASMEDSFESTLDVPVRPALLNGNIYLALPAGVRAYDLQAGNQLWEVTGIRGDLAPLAATDAAIFTRINDYVYRVTPDGRIVWPLDESTASPRPGIGGTGLLGGNERLYTAGSSTVRIVDKATGEFLDSINLGSGIQSVALTDGALVVLQNPPLVSVFADPEEFLERQTTAQEPLTLHVLGTTPLSIKADATLSTQYPAVGGAVRVDAANTRPGAFSDNTSFIVVWGDGTESRGPGPVFEHAYQERGEHLIRVQAVNDAGQQNSVGLRVYPGHQPSNWVSNAFSPENQESTFFTLGLILTLLFAGFGALRLRRKRGLLRKELARADERVASTRDNPDALREALREHRARARRLFLEGRLDEGSTGILERHIDELLRDHRLGTVEAKLGFLPHELFRAMQEMLRDAKVTQLERNQFLRSLDAVKGLTAAQRREVKRHVETWHRQDIA